MFVQQTRSHPNPPLECYLSVSSHPLENGFKRIKLLRTSLIHFQEDQFWDSQILLSCRLFTTPGKIDAQFSSTVKYRFLTSTKRSSFMGFPVVMQRLQSGFFSLLEMFFNPTQETEGIFNWSSIPNIEDQSSDHLCVSLLYFLQTLWHLHSCRH